MHTVAANSERIQRFTVTPCRASPATYPDESKYTLKRKTGGTGFGRLSGPGDSPRSQKGGDAEPDHQSGKQSGQNDLEEAVRVAFKLADRSNGGRDGPDREGKKNESNYFVPEHPEGAYNARDDMIDKLAHLSCHR
jgi:hypothetical protein